MKLSKDTSMLGRGVKRKWSCLEADPAAMEEKRPNVGAGEESDVNRLQQRQLVLSLCLKKLQHYQAGMELSLRRSVLLINTLRQIQEEIRSDGTPELLQGVDSDSCLLRDDFNEDMPVTCPGCAEGDGKNQPLPSSQEPSSPAPPASISISEAGNATSYLSDLPLDDIFEDIDTSMYETSDFSSVWSAGSLWPVSVSLWADEDLKLRPSSHPSTGSLQSCLMDLNELDHIMEILVKS